VENNNSDESESSQNVSVQNALPDQGQGGGARQKTSSQSKRNQETVNYEISKTTKVHVKETGTTKKLSVAVLVDGSYATGQDGKKAYTPRSKEELETLTNLVKTAIGFNADRGDKVEVINLQFSTPDIPEASEKDSLKQFIPNFDLTHLAELLVLSIVGLLILLMVVRPLLLKMMEGIPGQDGNSNGVSANTLGLGDQMFSDFEGNSIPISGSQGIPISQTSAGMTMGGDNRGSENNSSDSGIDIASIEGKFKTSNINKIGEIIDKHPEEAVSIIRSWMYAQP
jgi:flagellar M-ring protein FliF